MSAEHLIGVGFTVLVVQVVVGVVRAYAVRDLGDPPRVGGFDAADALAVVIILYALVWFEGEYGPDRDADAGAALTSFLFAVVGTGLKQVLGTGYPLNRHRD